MKEWFRKKLVYLKRNPQVIPKLLLVITCCFFTFNLTSYSYAAADVTNFFPAVSLFAVTLLSFLMVIAFVAMGASLRKKPITLAVTLLILVIEIALQITYVVILSIEIAKHTPEVIQSTFSAWPQSVVATIIHLVLLVLCLAAILTMPLYHKLLQKINTRRKDEDDEIEALKDVDILEGDDEEDVKELNRLEGVS